MKNKRFFGTNKIINQYFNDSIKISLSLSKMNDAFYIQGYRNSVNAAIANISKETYDGYDSLKESISKMRKYNDIDLSDCHDQFEPNYCEQFLRCIKNMDKVRHLIIKDLNNPVVFANEYTRFNIYKFYYDQIKLDIPDYVEMAFKKTNFYL